MSQDLTVPLATGDGHGAIMAHGGRHIKAAIATVFEALGGAQGLETWAKSSEDRKDLFYTKMAMKLIPKEVTVDDRRSVDDLILELDAGPSANPAPVVENVVDAEYETDEHYD